MPGRVAVSALLAATLVLAAGAYAQAPQDRTEVRTYGGFHFAESVSYDAHRDLYLAVNRGAPRDRTPNDGCVSLVNPDGTTQTPVWIGRSHGRAVLSDPLGSDIAGNRLYVADVDTVRWFDLETGAPIGSVQVEGVIFFNDLAVADDGTVYATQTGDDRSDTWRLYRITPQGQSAVLVRGPPLNRPNGVALDPKGNLVVVNMGTKDVLTFSPEGKLLATEQSADAGNDGLVILPDGTKYVSSVTEGTVSRLRPGEPAERIAAGIPRAASMTHDPKRNRLVIPMNEWNAVTFVQLE